MTTTPQVSRLLMVSVTSSLFAATCWSADTELITAPQRVAAATATANHAASCVAAQPFYWEIGNGQTMLASGQVGRKAPDAHTAMPIASASKWVYGAYVAERRQGKLSEADIQFLNFRSGYTGFRTCLRGQTVAECASSLINHHGERDDEAIGLFSYGGGHMQTHATQQMGLGSLDNDGLTRAIKAGLSPLGSNWAINYTQPQLAGGINSTAADYAVFLRGLITQNLQMGKLLGSHAVCTNPSVCPSQAVKTPLPITEQWQYSLGHWVESDPKVGDGSFSSPGAFGFYPWIDAHRRFYGIVARASMDGATSSDPAEKPYFKSIACGRDIRAAWLSGEARN